MSLLVITTGGTIDKVYFDATSDYEVGEPTVPYVFREAGCCLC
jgi:L-asparaginase